MKMKKVLFLLLIFAQYFFCVTNGKHCIVPITISWNLHIFNAIVPTNATDTKLTFHLVSEKDDFGYHDVTYNGPEYFLHFCENVGRTTTFYANFWCGTKKGGLSLFDDDVGTFLGSDPLIDNDIYWTVTEEGFYLCNHRDGHDRKLWAEW